MYIDPIFVKKKKEKEKLKNVIQINKKSYGRIFTVVTVEDVNSRILANLKLLACL